MSQTTCVPFTYSVIRYVHDPVADERLNIGIVVYCPSLGYLDAKIERRYERLSRAFVGFDSETYRRQLDALDRSLFHVKHDQQSMFQEDRKPDMDSILRRILPDNGLSVQYGTPRGGMTPDPEAELLHLFDRAIALQGERDRRERRSDEEVMRTYERLLPQPVRHALKAQRFVTPEAELRFEHAFKNERWHVLQPISLDFLDQAGIQRKATSWLGNAVALEDAIEPIELYYLVGSPADPDFRTAYEKGLRLLDKSPITHKIIREEDAEAFAEWLEDYMAQHDVIPPSQVSKSSDNADGKEL